MPQQGLITGFCTSETLNGLSRDHKNVNRGLGSDVSESQAEIISVDLIARNVASENFSEDRVFRHGLSGGESSVP